MLRNPKALCHDADVMLSLMWMSSLLVQPLQNETDRIVALSECCCCSF